MPASWRVLGQPRGGGIAGRVAVVGDQHALDAVALEGGQVVGGETAHAIGRRHLAVAGAPEGHGVQQRLAQDDFAACSQRLDVPQAAMRTRQVQVHRRAGAQPGADLAPVDFRDRAVFVQHRHHQRAVEVLVPGIAHHAQLLQPRADRRAGLAVFLRQAQAQGAVGKAQVKALDQRRIVQAARFKIGQGFRAALQGRVVVVDHLAQQRGVVRIRRHRRGQLGHRGAAHHAVTDRQRRPALAQQLHRMPEAHALGPHHPVDHRAAGLARTQAVPQVLVRRDHQRRRLVLVERTAPDQVGAVALERDAPRLDQALQRHLGFQLLDLACGDAGHKTGLRRKSCQGGNGKNNSVAEYSYSEYSQPRFCGVTYYARCIPSAHDAHGS